MVKMKKLKNSNKLLNTVYQLRKTSVWNIHFDEYFNNLPKYNESN